MEHKKNIIGVLDEFNKWLATENKEDKNKKELVETDELEEVKENVKTLLSKEEPKEEVDLDKRVQNFLDDYRKTVHELRRSGEYVANLETVLMEAFINKMAAWYEMVYPDDLLYWTFPTKYEDPHDFICLLTDVEREMLHKHRYRDDCEDDDVIKIRDIWFDSIYSYVIVGDNAIIKEADGVYRYSKGRVDDSELIGLNLEEAAELLKNADVDIEDSQLACVIRNHNKRLQLREDMLDAIMYKLIEHGTYNDTGCMRAYIFAKDFGRDINIPIIYSRVISSKAYREFINTYIHDGGDIDIEHYNDYFLDKYGIYKTEEEKFRKTSLRHSMYLVNEEDYNTKEETSLYQRLADKLVTGLTNSDALDELGTEAIKEMRIERKINRIKNR